MRIKASHVIAILNREWPNGSKRFSAAAMVLEHGSALTKVVVRAALSEHEAAHPELVRTRWETVTVGNDDIACSGDPMTAARFKKLCEVYGKPDVRKDASGKLRLRPAEPGAKHRLGPIPAGAFYTRAPERAPHEPEWDYEQRVRRMADTKGFVYPSGVRRVFICARGRGVSRQYEILPALDLECARRLPGVLGAAACWTNWQSLLEDLTQDTLKAAYFGKVPLPVSPPAAFQLPEHAVATAGASP